MYLTKTKQISNFEKNMFLSVEYNIESENEKKRFSKKYK